MSGPAEPVENRPSNVCGRGINRIDATTTMSECEFHEAISVGIGQKNAMDFVLADWLGWMTGAIGKNIRELRESSTSLRTDFLMLTQSRGRSDGSDYPWYIQ